MAINVGHAAGAGPAAAAGFGGGQGRVRQRAAIGAAQFGSRKALSAQANVQSLERQTVAAGHQMQAADAAQVRRRDDLEFSMTAKQNATIARLAEADAGIQASTKLTPAEKIQAHRQVENERLGIQPVKQARKPSRADDLKANTREIDGRLYGINQDGTINPTPLGPERQMSHGDRIKATQAAYRAAADAAASPGNKTSYADLLTQARNAFGVGVAGGPGHPNGPAGEPSGNPLGTPQNTSAFNFAPGGTPIPGAVNLPAQGGGGQFNPGQVPNIPNPQAGGQVDPSQLATLPAQQALPGAAIRPNAHHLAQTPLLRQADPGLTDRNFIDPATTTKIGAALDAAQDAAQDAARAQAGSPQQRELPASGAFSDKQGRVDKLKKMLGQPNLPPGMREELVKLIQGAEKDVTDFRAPGDRQRKRRGQRFGLAEDIQPQMTEEQKQAALVEEQELIGLLDTQPLMEGMTEEQKRAALAEEQELLGLLDTQGGDVPGTTDAVTAKAAAVAADPATPPSERVAAQTKNIATKQAAFDKLTKGALPAKEAQHRWQRAKVAAQATGKKLTSATEVVAKLLKAPGTGGFAETLSDSSLAPVSPLGIASGAAEAAGFRERHSMGGDLALDGIQKKIASLRQRLQAGGNSSTLRNTKKQLSEFVTAEAALTKAMRDSVKAKKAADGFNPKAQSAKANVAKRELNVAIRSKRAADARDARIARESR